MIWEAVACWEEGPPRRLAALAMRRATEDRAERLAVVPALRLWVRVEDFADAVVLGVAEADLLREAGLLPVEAVDLDFVPVVADDLALLIGLDFAAARVLRAFEVAVVGSTSSVAEGLDAAAAVARREREEGAAAFARADGRALTDRVGAVAGVERVRWLSTRAHSSSLKDEGLEPWDWATFAALSISAMRFSHDVANRLSD